MGQVGSGERTVLEPIQSHAHPGSFSIPDGPGQVWLTRGLGSDPVPILGSNVCLNKRLNLLSLVFLTCEIGMLVLSIFRYYY